MNFNSNIISGCQPSLLPHSSNDTNTDYYRLLNCSQHSSSEQIQTEYKHLAMLYHPDKAHHPDMQSSGSKAFELMTKARNVLVNPTTREIYDRWLVSGLEVTFDDYKAMNDKFSFSHFREDSISQAMLKSTQIEDSSRNDSKIIDDNQLWRRGGEVSYKSNGRSLFRNYKL